MTNKQLLREDIHKAVQYATQSVGIETVKQLSFFARNQKEANDTYKIAA